MTQTRGLQLIARCCIVVIETIENELCKIFRAYEKYVQDPGAE